MLYEAGKAMNSVLVVDEVLQLILSSAFDLLGASSGSIMLLEDEGDLVVVCRAGNASGAPIELGGGIASRVARDREPLLVQGTVSEKGHQETESAVCVPLQHRGQVLGRHQPDRCRRAHLQRVRPAGRVAVRRARRHRRRQRPAVRGRAGPQRPAVAPGRARPAHRCGQPRAHQRPARPRPGPRAAPGVHGGRAVHRRRQFQARQRRAGPRSRRLHPHRHRPAPGRVRPQLRHRGPLRRGRVPGDLRGPRPRRRGRRDRGNASSRNSPAPSAPPSASGPCRSASAWRRAPPVAPARSPASSALRTRPCTRPRWRARPASSAHFSEHPDPPEATPGRARCGCLPRLPAAPPGPSPPTALTPAPTQAPQTERRRCR